MAQGSAQKGATIRRSPWRDDRLHRPDRSFSYPLCGAGSSYDRPAINERTPLWM